MLERHRGRHPPGPFVEVSVAPTRMQPAFEEHVAIDAGRASHPIEQRLSTPPRRPDER